MWGKMARDTAVLEFGPNWIIVSMTSPELLQGYKTL